MPDAVITKFDGGGENVGQLRLMALVRLLGGQDAAAEARDTGPWWQVPGRTCRASGGVRWPFG